MSKTTARKHFKSLKISPSRNCHVHLPYRTKMGNALLKTAISQPDGLSTAESYTTTPHKETLRFLKLKNQPTMMTSPFSEKKWRLLLSH